MNSQIYVREVVSRGRAVRSQKPLPAEHLIWRSFHRNICDMLRDLSLNPLTFNINDHQALFLPQNNRVTKAVKESVDSEMTASNVLPDPISMSIISPGSSQGASDSQTMPAHDLVITYSDSQVSATDETQNDDNGDNGNGNYDLRTNVGRTVARIAGNQKYYIRNMRFDRENLIQCLR